MRRSESAAPRAASLTGRDIAPERDGGELIGDLDGPLAVVSSDGTVARLPLAIVRNSFQPVSAVGPDGCVAALSLLQPQAFVDPDDASAPLDRGWRIAWAVGTEDRWHIAGREAAVRSRLVDDVPVTETAMRIPGGDVVQRVGAARDGSNRGVLLEFENKSPGPVSLALAVIENDTWRGGADVRNLRQRRDPAVVEVRESRLMVDGQVALDLGRTPGGAVAVADGGVWTAVGAGPASGDCLSQSRSGRAAAAAVVPLVPGAPMRAVVPIYGALDHGAARSVGASGWQAVVARAATVSLPDETAMRAWRRGITVSIVAAGCGGVLSRSGCLSSRARRPNSHNGMIVPAVRMARTAVVLDRVGLPDEAERARGTLVEAAGVSLLSGEEANTALRALASRRLRTGRVSGLAELAGPLAEAAGDHLDAFTLEQVAAALETEAPAAARDARRLLAETGSPSPTPDAAATVDRLSAVVRDSVAFGRDGLAGIEDLLDCLVAEAADRLVIAPSMPDEWIGATVDAHGLLTRHGTLSFSLRWHGPRPAVLWDLQPRRDEDPAVTVRCGLDESWASEARTGEALLRTGQATS